jgi:hypothetical protein
MKNNFKYLLFACFMAFTSALFAQGIRELPQSQANAPRASIESPLPLKKVVILTSGLAYFEHSGSVNGPASIAFPFRTEAVSDALKSLVINDPSSSNPSVTYQSENTLIETLRSLSINLADNPGLAETLSRLRGAEIEVRGRSEDEIIITGRIVSVEVDDGVFPFIFLDTENGVNIIHMFQIGSLKFTDPVIEQDLKRALDILASSRNNNTRELLVNLPANGRRDVSISYVIPYPVWKVSYRLDLSSDKPLFQGWAIVDNDGDTDWNNVQLSLVTGRPSSFIQNLYPPYYVSRPVLPLSIAGTADAATYDRARAAGGTADTAARSPAPAAVNQARSEQTLAAEQSYLQESIVAMIEREMQTAAGSAVGGQFEFTIQNPVTLDRRMSAMLPLVQSRIEGRSTLIYTGTGRNPRLGAAITNNTGMKLPAGPITVYDGGVYAGDALIEFWNENENRLISFGEDLSVTAASSNVSRNTISTVTISNGVMTTNRNLTYNKTYTFINSASAAKQLVVEHAKTAYAELVSPSANEQTVAAYRFNVTLAANQTTTLTVDERRPVSERVTLLSQRPETLLSYSTNQEIPANVRQAIAQAINLKQAADNAAAAAKDIEAQRSRLIADQDRVRRNLEAVSTAAAGNQTQQGQDYLQRLVALDSEIDAMTTTLERANSDAKAAQQAYENYLNGLNL